MEENKNEILNEDLSKETDNQIIKDNVDSKLDNFKNDKVNDVDFEIIWEGQPAGLWERFLNKLHLNFTVYQITKDELIIKEGFFRRRTNTMELYTLKDPDLIETLVQRWLGVGNIYVTVDTHSSNNLARKVVLRNIEEPEKIRKILRDAIEADVMERKITYVDKV